MLLTSVNTYISRINTRGLRAFTLLALLLQGSWASAHEFWLVPHDAVTSVDQKVVFELRIGPTWPGVQTPRLPHLVDWFTVVDAQGKRDVEGRVGSYSVGHLLTRSAGATVVAMRTNKTRIDLPADEFNQYLHEEGLNAVLALRQRYDLMQMPAREQYSRSAKSIVLVEGKSDGFDRVMDLPLEFIALSDPLKLAPHGTFKLQLLLNGEPLAESQVNAQLKADPPIQLTAITDAQGHVAFSLPASGLWLFSTVYMEASSDDGIDWESLWSSLTVAIPSPDQVVTP